MQVGLPPLPVENEDDEAETSTFEDNSVVLGDDSVVLGV